MLLTFKSFTTIADGTIYHLTVLPGVQPKYTIEETVGDEFSIKHGDLTLFGLGKTDLFFKVRTLL